MELKDNTIVELVIKADESVFDDLSEEDNFEFGYGIYAPEFYVRAITLNNEGKAQIGNQDAIDNDVALYFIEHNEVNITLEVNENQIMVDGSVKILGQKYPLQISMNR